jgi:hypothetical protein
MKIKLTPEESEKLFYDSLCNAVGTGHMNGHGLKMTCDSIQYEKSHKYLKCANPDSIVCYEDILMQVLRDGGTLTFIDLEGEYNLTRSITLADVHERVEKTPLIDLTDAIEELGDAYTADAILQTVFFEDIIFL